MIGKTILFGLMRQKMNFLGCLQSDNFRKLQAIGSGPQAQAQLSYPAEQ